MGECGTRGRDVEGRLREPGRRLIQSWSGPRIPPKIPPKIPPWIPGGLGDGVSCPRPFFFPQRFGSWQNPTPTTICGPLMKWSRVNVGRGVRIDEASGITRPPDSRKEARKP